MADTDGGSAIADVSGSACNSGIVTNNMTRQMTPAASLNIGKARTVTLAANTTPIANITSYHFPGERVVFRPAGGSAYFAAGGNINFGNIPSPFEVSVDETITLIKFDQGTLCVIKSPPVAKGLEPKPARWYCNRGISVSTAALSDGVMRGSRFPVERSCTLTQLACEVTAAGSAGAMVRAAIYLIDPVPQALSLLVDGGQVDATTVGMKVVAISVPVVKGQQLILAGVNQGGATTPATLRSNGGHDPYMSGAVSTDISGIAAVGLSIAGVTGAPPSTPNYGLVGSAVRVLITAT